MEPKFVSLDAMYLTGIATRTTNAEEMSEAGKIAGLWEQFFATGVTGRISDIKQPHYTYTLYAQYENGAQGEYTVLIGHEAHAADRTEEGLEAIAVPAAKYAVFTTERGPVGEVVTEAWQKIWAWSATAAERRTFTGDFERYDGRDFNPQDAVVQIFVAVE